MKEHKPMGNGFGINPGRVSWIHAPDVMNWKNGRYWWDPENYNENIMDKMVLAAITDLTSEMNPSDAWNKIFKFHNEYLSEIK